LESLEWIPEKLYLLVTNITVIPAGLNMTLIGPLILVVIAKRVIVQK